MNESQSAVTIREVYPYLRLRRANEAIDFYAQAFGATELFRLTEPSGRIGHAELQFGPSVIMLSEEYPEHGILGPESTGGPSVSIHLHVEDVDAVFARAVAAGAIAVRPPTDHFYGERSGTVRDPFGHDWLLGHQIEEVAPEEMQRRYAVESST
ncbi:MAG: VOC family protein [Candidatus Eremiobacteraeota bacterium]|nr:VOC family protein [Candidatus Eremiobacteraeota bacterium]MBC5827819.1 VOC family protein [Candidatus Eremiobacteraeota bacterium]